MINIQKFIKSVYSKQLIHKAKKLAFTLAETLLVVGIIGVVAALTLPNVNNSTSEKETVAKLKKIYSYLNNALGQAELKYGKFSSWPPTSQMFASRMQEFLKITKYCGFTNQDDCHVYNGGGQNNSMPTMILADGSSLVFSGVNDCYRVNNNDIYTYCGTIQVDVDGPKKGRNTQRYDQFDFYITKEKGILPRGYEVYNFSRTQCFTQARNCAAWVIDYGNQDYLKANSSGKCNNSNVTLSETVTTCR